MKPLKDFWLSCGHHLTDRDTAGGLLITDEFLKAYLARPELAPRPASPSAHCTLHCSPIRAAASAATRLPQSRTLTRGKIGD
jgi:hypothetical protein